MKKALILLMFILPVAALAQQKDENDTKTHAVYLEIGGSTEVGVNYDQRFSKDSRWGWRAGLSFAYSGSESFFQESNSTRAWAVPLEVNYLVGNHRNSLELGVWLPAWDCITHIILWSPLRMSARRPSATIWLIRRNILMSRELLTAIAVRHSTCFHTMRRNRRTASAITSSVISPTAMWQGSASSSVRE